MPNIRQQHLCCYYSQEENLKMKTKYLIDEKICIDYRNNKYYLRIRSCDINNPVMLFLHGGPGTPDRGQTMHYQSSLADKFTLVCFDQRGSGLAYDKKEPDLTLATAIEDLHNVVDYLKERFNKEKLIDSFCFDLNSLSNVSCKV